MRESKRSNRERTKRASRDLVFAVTIVAFAGACETNTGLPGEIGVYRVDAAGDGADATTTVELEGGQPEGAADGEASTASGSCRPGHYQGTYAGFWTSADAGVSFVTGSVDLTLSSQAGEASLAATGTWQLQLSGSLAYPLIATGSLDCSTTEFDATLVTAPASSARGLLSATYRAGTTSLENGNFVISFNNDDPPMLGVTPNPGLTGTFRAPWVGP
jgi:hypothetical protein